MLNKHLISLLLLIVAMGFSALSSAADPNESFIQNVTVNAAAELIDQNPDIVILDVRTPVEYWYSHIENAVNINYYSFSFNSQLRQLDRNKTYIVHCHSGVRSGNTLPLMQEAGFNKIYHMNGGFSAWKSADLPTT